jgi:hypothetical protein
MHNQAAEMAEMAELTVSSTSTRAWCSGVVGRLDQALCVLTRICSTSPMPSIANFDLSSFWGPSEYALRHCLDLPPAPEEVATVEAGLGLGLPMARIVMGEMHSGGIPLRQQSSTAGAGSDPRSVGLFQLKYLGSLYVNPNSMVQVGAEYASPCGHFGMRAAG